MPLRAKSPMEECKRLLATAGKPPVRTVAGTARDQVHFGINRPASGQTCPLRDLQAHLGTDGPASEWVGPPGDSWARLGIDRPAAGQLGPPRDQ